MRGIYGEATVQMQMRSNSIRLKVISRLPSETNMERQVKDSKIMIWAGNVGPFENELSKHYQFDHSLTLAPSVRILDAIEHRLNVLQLICTCRLEIRSNM